MSQQLLKPVGEVDINGNISLSKTADLKKTVPVRKINADYNNTYVRTQNFSCFPQIDIQWMVLGCDPTSPQRELCEELPVRHLLSIPRCILYFASHIVC